MNLIEALGIALVLAALTVPIIIIAVVHYFKKRLEHKQILAAIEKGTPLSEIRPPKPRPTGLMWIRCLSSGVGLLIVAYGFLGPGHGEDAMIGSLILGIAVSLILRGILYRKYRTADACAGRNGMAPSTGQS